MKRTGWRASLAAAALLGLGGATAWGEDVTWTAVNGKLTKTDPAAPMPGEAKLTVKPPPPERLLVKPVAALKAPTDIWTKSSPAEPTNSNTAFITAAPIAVPVLTDDGVWKSSSTKPILQKASNQVPDLPVVTLPMPQVLPEPPNPTEPIPSPLSPPQAMPKPAVLKPEIGSAKPETKSPSHLLNAPITVPAPATPMAFTPTPALPASDSTSVWGGYNNALRATASGVVPAGTVLPCDTNCPPTRHGTYGSPSLKLSRDYHMLDALAHPAAGGERGIFKEASEVVETQHYVSAEYLMWWMTAGNIPALGTTAGDRMFGYLGEPGTTLLLGPGKFGDTARQGVRLRAGTWFDDCHECGLDGSVFVLGSRSTSATFDSSQYPTIARPFFAPNFNREFSELVAFPGLSTGRLNVTLNSSVWGADMNYRRGITNDCDRSCEWFAGYRFLSLKEDLTITENLIAEANAPDPVGTTIVVRDRFAVTNSFHGGQLGMAAERRWGDFSISGRGSIALGANVQELEITGSQVRTRPGQSPQTFTGGLLAVGPNLGTFTRNRFSVLPEATINLGYNIRPQIKMFVGYNFLAVTNVIRPGDQIDRVVDLTYIPNAPTVPFSGQARPQPLFKQSDLVIQGFQFGVQGSW